MTANSWRPDLSNESVRLNLAVRHKPYFNLIEYCRHVGLQVEDEHNAYWIARVRKRDGGYKQKRLGRERGENSDCIGFPQALELAVEWFETRAIRAIASEAYPLGSKRSINICPIGPEYTIGHALSDYLDWKLLAATRSHYETLVSLINYHLVPRLSHQPLSTFNASVFQVFARDVLETPPKKGRVQSKMKARIQSLGEEELRRRKKTLNSLVSILRGAFELAWEADRIDNDKPLRCLRRVPNVDRPRVIFLDRTECRSLMSACDQDLRDLVYAALLTGCRARELTNMAVGDFSEKTSLVFVAHPKGQRTRHIYLPEEARRFFGGLVGSRGRAAPMFLRKNGRAWGGEYKYHFRVACDRASLTKELTFHGLRHTYASQLVQSGASLSAVAEQLGHADTQTVSSTYGHLAARHRFAEIDRHFEPIRFRHDSQPGRAISCRSDVVSNFTLNTDHTSWPRSNFSKLNGPLLAVLGNSRLSAPSSV